jgi:hypothetical protein
MVEIIHQDLFLGLPWVLHNKFVYFLEILIHDFWYIISSFIENFLLIELLFLGLWFFWLLSFGGGFLELFEGEWLVFLFFLLLGLSGGFLIIFEDTTTEIVH